LTASNPGQFYYNVFVDVDPEVNFVELTIPYPFVTQGAMPIHAYSSVTPIDLDEDGIIDCFEPEDVLMAWGDSPLPIKLDSYTEDTNGDEVYGSFGDTVTITLDVSGLAGLVYVNIHLDYGLKGPDVDADGDDFPDRYDKAENPDGTADAVDYNSIADILIEDRYGYNFSTAFDGFSHSDTVINVNEFKKIPGVAGFICANSGCTAFEEGALVKLIIPADVKTDLTEMLTSTDEDGWYMIEYKHKGKPNDQYKIQVWLNGTESGPPDYDVFIKLKGNAYVEQHFIPK
jgi:hypothetical protein